MKKIFYLQRFLVAVFFILLVAKTHAQDTCKTAYAEAEKAFQIKDYPQVITILKDKINTCKYSNDLKLNALQMLNESYLATGDTLEAKKDSCTLIFLQAERAFEQKDYKLAIELLKNHVNTCEYTNLIKLKAAKILAVSVNKIEDLNLYEEEIIIDSCQLAYVEANKAFTNGDYKLVIDLLKDRTNACDYSRETKLQILKLLSASYSEMDEIEAAEKQTYKFIKKSPEYELQSIDDKQFINNFNKFKIRPNWAFGMDLIVMNSEINVQKKYKILNTDTYELNYSNKKSYVLNIVIIKHLSKRIFSSSEFTNYNVRFSKNYSYGENLDYVFNESFFVLKVSEAVGLKILRYKNLSFNFIAGGYGYYIQNLDLDQEVEGEKVDLDYDFQKMRMPGNGGIVYGMLINYKHQRFNFRIQTKRSRDFFSHNIANQRYMYPDLNIKYFYVDDDILFSMQELTFGVAFNIFYKVKHKYHK